MKLNKKRIELTSHAKMQVVDMNRNLRGTLRATYTQRIRKYERKSQTNHTRNESSQL